MTGLTAQEAQKRLSELGLSGEFLGTGESVTDQLPASGQIVPGGSEVLVYMGEKKELPAVKVPDFLGMHRQQAMDTAGKLGLYILVTGNPDISQEVTVTNQSYPKDMEVPAGTTITLEFTNTTARD